MKMFKKVFGSKKAKEGHEQRAEAAAAAAMDQAEVKNLVAAAKTQQQRPKQPCSTGAARSKGEKRVQSPGGTWYTESDIIAMEALKAAERDTHAAAGREGHTRTEAGRVAGGAGSGHAASSCPLDNEEELKSESVLPPPKEDPLPDGWRSHTDPQSGRMYYFNKSLKITQWERPTNTTSAPPPPAKDVAAARDSLDEDTLALYTALRGQIEELKGDLRQRSVQARGDKAEFMKHGQEYRYYKEVIDWLDRRKKDGLPLPLYRAVPRQTTKTVNVNPDIAGRTMRVVVHGIANIETLDKIQVKLTFPWPRDSPQERVAPEVKTCSDFAEWTVDFEAVRTSRLQRCAQGKTLKLMIEVSGVSKSLFNTSTTLLGKADVELCNLYSESTLFVPEVMLRDTQRGLKMAECGGSLSISIKIMKPWSNQDATNVTETVIVLLDQKVGDPPPNKAPGVEAEHARLVAAAEASCLAVPATATASGKHKTGGGGKTAGLNVVELEGKYKEGKRLFEKSNVKPGCTPEQIEECRRNLLEAQKLLLEVKNGSSKPYRNTQATLEQIKMRLERLASLEARVDDGGGVCAETDADVLHDEAAAGSGRGRPEDGPEVSGDKQTPHCYPLRGGGGEEDDFMPHSLLTYEIQKCDAEIAKARGADKTHWEEEKEAYCMSLENLEMSIETSTITETEYVQRLSAAIKREEARARSDTAKGPKYREAMRRAKVMQDELKQTGGGAQGAEELSAAAQKQASAPGVPNMADIAPTMVPSATSPPAPLAAAATPAVTAAEGPVDDFMPHSLLTYEIQKCDAEIAKARGADKTHWEEEKEAYCMSLENLEMSIETSTITETEYVQRLSAAIKREEARARSDTAKGPKYREAMRRAKVMQDELKQTSTG